MKDGHVKFTTQAIPVSECDGACFAGALFEWIRHSELGLNPVLFNRNFCSDGVFGLNRRSRFYQVKIKRLGIDDQRKHDAVVILDPDSGEVLIIEALPEHNMKYDDNGVLVAKEEKEVDLLEMSKLPLQEFALDQLRMKAAQAVAVHQREKEITRSMEHLKPHLSPPLLAVTQQAARPKSGDFSARLRTQSARRPGLTKSVVFDDDRRLLGSRASGGSFDQGLNMLQQEIDKLMTLAEQEK
ncbi:hypothetical protein M3P05_19075 [Sansalvadorimonas sp. 2012CJ34-2]|uniref:Uncharacterized protein n=1 Tax=Parendozoicomonas callyspongiae TaxID=2942213 RepID=A0ABT0PKY2_9GAMM|nr:hypothetical protein [Sansalvadorimonas sp. 2012CJ34-2]MCL6272028.1 hypothetical protein [Sansalvadorimonas sp. 2012CJ34-2]